MNQAVLFHLQVNLQKPFQGSYHGRHLGFRCFNVQVKAGIFNGP